MPAKKAARKAVTPAPSKKAAGKSVKPATKAAVRKPTRRKVAMPEIPSVPDIETAAYFHYLDRIARGLPGDALGDWLAAENSYRS